MADGPAYTALEVPIASTCPVGGTTSRQLRRDVAEDSKPMIWCSITAHTIINVNVGAQQFSAFFELDFKFNLAAVLKAVRPCFFKLESEDIHEISAEQVKVPFLLVNSGGFEILHENHFFKVASGVENPVSMYGAPETVKCKAKTNEDCWKCEKYVISGSFKYFTNDSLYPFGDVVFMIKVGTDGRPGSEKLGMHPHEDDCSYPAFSRNVYGFTPYMKKSDDGKVTPLVHYDYPKIEHGTYAGSYPRCYMLICCRRSPVEEWLKFYAIPFVATFYSFIYEFNDTDNFAAAVGTNVLAFIALLFTLPPSSSMTFAEMAVLSFCAIEVMAGIYMAYTGVMAGLHMAELCAGWVILLTVVQWGIAAYKNKRVRDLIEQGRFSEVDDSYL